MSAINPEMESLKTRLKAMWMAGDFGQVAKVIEANAEEFIARLALRPGARVLDVACGSGNLSIPAARAGAVVTGVDIATNLLEQARARAESEGLTIQFDEGDAESLPYADASFDEVVSMYGAMFAPRPERVASELFRVVRPGGTVGMANWRPDGFQAGFFEIITRYRPPEPEGVQPSIRWGDEACVRERFAGLAEEVRVVPSIVPWGFASLQEMAEFFQNAMPRPPEHLDDERRQQLAMEMLEHVQRHNKADDDSVAIEAEYSIVVARKPS